MRWLRARLELSTSDSAETGAVNVIVVILMTALLGFTAIVVDVGLAYAERSQLQNGADAAALAVAQECARDLAGAECAPTSPMAHSLADQNALDGMSSVRAVALDKPRGEVVVTLGAKENGATANRVSLFFARALGFDSAEVSARSKAVWGSPVAGRTAFPLAVSVCQVENRVNGALQRLQAHGSGANPVCNYGPSGQSVPGGFGWITPEPNVCGGYIDLALNEGGSDPGNNSPPNCSTTLQKWASEINAGRAVTILMPVFNKVTGTGSSAAYGLTAFAAFDVAGWKFSGSDSLPATFRNTAAYVGSAQECVGSCRGVIGKFITYVSLDDGYALGPNHRYGASIVRLGE
jgi:hypothetical protein